MKKYVDVSHFQLIDWKKFNPDGVIMKTTQGTTYVDPTFKENQKQARLKGLLRAYYHFAQPTDSKKEARWFIKNVGDLQEGEFLVLDWEVQYDNYAVWCMDFCNEVERLCGVRPIMYMNASTANQKWTAFKGTPLWIAKYGINDGKPHDAPPAPNWKIVLWQYTSNGTVKGIDTRVDLSQTDINLRRYGKKIEPVVVPIVETPQTSAQGQETVPNAPITVIQVSDIPIEVKTQPEAVLELKAETVVYPTSQDIPITPEPTINPYQAELNKTELSFTPWYVKIINFLISLLK